jgi:hypothetical protein
MFQQNVLSPFSGSLLYCHLLHVDFVLILLFGLKCSTETSASYYQPTGLTSHMMTLIKTVTTFLNPVNKPVFLMEEHHVSCEVRTECIY